MGEVEVEDVHTALLVRQAEVVSCAVITERNKLSRVENKHSHGYDRRD